MNNNYSLIEEKLADLNNLLMKVSPEQLPAGLCYGKMGICIYYYHLAKETDLYIYREFAEKLLEEVYREVNENTPIDFDTGLSGISWGFMYLEEQGFLQGDTSEALKELDDKIFRDLSFLWIDQSQRDVYALIKVIPYLVKRLQRGTYSDEKQFIYEHLIIKAINKIETTLCTDDWEEPAGFDIFAWHLPVYLYVLGKVYAAGIYTCKIKKIAEELSSKVLSIIPRLHANRLLLVAGMASLNRYTGLPEWNEHLLFLQKQIRPDVILTKELRNKQVFIRSGIAGCCLLLHLLRKELGQQHFCVAVNKADIGCFLLRSTIWEEELASAETLFQYAGIMNGFPGIALLYRIYK